jgi:hypothetical protein
LTGPVFIPEQASAAVPDNDFFPHSSADMAARFSEGIEGNTAEAGSGLTPADRIQHIFFTGVRIGYAGAGGVLVLTLNPVMTFNFYVYLFSTVLSIPLARMNGFWPVTRLARTALAQHLLPRPGCEFLWGHGLLSRHPKARVSENEPIHLPHPGQRHADKLASTGRNSPVHNDDRRRALDFNRVPDQYATGERNFCRESDPGLRQANAGLSTDELQGIANRFLRHHR